MKYEKLIRAIREIEEYLRSCNDFTYASLLSDYANRIEEINGEATNKKRAAAIEGLSHHAFGGMGSLNDLYLCKENGHKVTDVDSANKKLNGLLKRLQKELHGLTRT